MNVFICSRFSADNDKDLQHNITIAEDLMAICRTKCHYSFAPHLFYPKYLDDNEPSDRDFGIAAGISFLDWCDCVWMHVSDGISSGMIMENKVMMTKRIPVCIVESKSCFHLSTAIEYEIHATYGMFRAVVKQGEVTL